MGQLSSNERFALFFAEKRPFFLEGVDRFDTPNRLIYTRQLGDPVAGLKLTGKVAGMNVGLLSGVDASRTNSAGGESNLIFNALRLRRDVGGQSTVGIVYTDRIVGDDFNRVAAADARLVFGGLYTLALQGGASFTRSGGTTRDAPIWEANFQRTGRRLVLGSRIAGVHPDFETQAGFVNRPGVISTRVNTSVNLYGQPGASSNAGHPGSAPVIGRTTSGCGTRPRPRPRRSCRTPSSFEVGGRFVSTMGGRATSSKPSATPTMAWCVPPGPAPIPSHGLLRIASKASADGCQTSRRRSSARSRADSVGVFGVTWVSPRRGGSGCSVRPLP